LGIDFHEKVCYYVLNWPQTNKFSNGFFIAQKTQYFLTMRFFHMGLVWRNWVLVALVLRPFTLISVEKVAFFYSQKGSQTMNATTNSNKFLLCPNCGKIGIENLVSNGNIAHCKTCNHPIIEMRYLSVQAQIMATGDGQFRFDHDGQTHAYEIDHDGCIQFETGKLGVVYLLETRNMACAVIHAVHMLKADKLARETIAQNTSIAFMPYQASAVTSTMDMATTQEIREVEMRPQPVQQQQAQHGGKGKVKTVIIPFSQAVSIALKNATSEMLARAKVESVKKFESRVKSFLGHEFKPSLGLNGSILAYLNRLELAGKSASYIRGLKSVLNSFMAFLPTCQIDFRGVTL